MVNVTSVMHYGGYVSYSVTSVMHYGGYISYFVTFRNALRRLRILFCNLRNALRKHFEHYGTITEVTPRAYTDVVCAHFRSYIKILQYSNLGSIDLNRSFYLKKIGENLLIW